MPNPPPPNSKDPCPHTETVERVRRYVISWSVYGRQRGEEAGSRICDVKFKTSNLDQAKAVFEAFKLLKTAGAINSLQIESQFPDIERGPIVVPDWATS